MSVFRTFWKWIFRGCLFVILVLVLGWVEMRVSRA